MSLLDSMRAARKQKNICLIVDVPGWAFDNIAQNISNELKDKYEIDIIYSSMFPDLSTLYRELFIGYRNYDLIHFFWHPNLSSIYNTSILYNAVKDLNLEQRQIFCWNIARTYKTTSIYDHLFLDESECSNAVLSKLVLADAYTVSSSKLNNIYSNMKFIKSPEMVISDGVDLAIFRPNRVIDLTKNSEHIRVGWAGNSKWGAEGDDHKGLKTVIEPLIAQLSRDNYFVEGRFCDRCVKLLPREVMPEYYNSIDLYICASLSEGTPNPILEAMACGVPILTTDVGVVKEIFGPLQQEFIVEDRNSPEFLAKLRELVINSELRKKLSIENVESIKSWSWKSKSEQWNSFFLNILSSENVTYESRLKEQVVLLELCRIAREESNEKLYIEQQRKEISEFIEKHHKRYWFLYPRLSLQRLLFYFNDLKDFFIFYVFRFLTSKYQINYCNKKKLPTSYFKFDWWKYIKENRDLPAANICRAPDAARHWLMFAKLEERILRPYCNSENIRPYLNKIKRADLTIVTRISSGSDDIAEQKKSLLLQNYQNFNHIVYYNESPENSYLEKYIDGESRRVEKSLISSSDAFLGSCCLKHILSQFEDSWLLFLDEDEKLSRPDTLDALMSLARDRDSLLLWKLGLPGWRQPSVVPPVSIEYIESRYAGFMVHSMHISKLVWDDYLGEDYRLLRRLVDELNPIWIDDVLTYFDYLDFELSNRKSRAEELCCVANVKYDFRNIFDFVIIMCSNQIEEERQLKIFQSESVYNVSSLKVGKFEQNLYTKCSKLHTAPRFLFIKPGISPRKQFLSKFAEFKFEWNPTKEKLCFVDNISENRQIVAIALSGEHCASVFEQVRSLNFSDLIEINGISSTEITTHLFNIT